VRRGSLIERAAADGFDHRHRSWRNVRTETVPLALGDLVLLATTA